MHYLLIGYMFLFIHRPFEVWPWMGDLHIERLYMLLTLAVWTMTPGKRWISNPIHGAFLAFGMAVLVSWGLSPWMSEGQLAVESYFKIVVFYVLLVTTVNDERKLKHVVLGFVCVMAIYMTHSLREYMGGRFTHRMGIARMLGVDDTLGNPNSFGASITLALPFALIFWTQAKRWAKLALTGYFGLSILCVLLTGSRGSFLCLILLTAILAMRSRHRFAWLTVGLIAGPVMFVALPPSLQNRFETIINPEVGPENAYESGMGRVEGFKLGFELLERFPISGCGPGAWIPATHSKFEAHNLIGQTVGEMGVLGAITLSAIIIVYIGQLIRLKKLTRRLPPGGDDFIPRLGAALGMGLVVLFFQGISGHNLFRYNWLWYGAFLLIAVHCLQVRLASAARVANPVRMPVPRMLSPWRTNLPRPL